MTVAEKPAKKQKKKDPGKKALERRTALAETGPSASSSASGRGVTA